MPTNAPTIPPDDLRRNMTRAHPDNLPHIGLVGDTYTVTVTGDDTGGRFCVIDMHIPPGGGPPPHRHDFEETFIVLEGEMETTFRGKKSILRAGETLNIPANAPHRFHNTSIRLAHLLCICSPAGTGEFLQRCRSAGRYAHDAAAEAEPGRANEVHRESEGPRSQVPHRTAYRGIGDRFHSLPAALTQTSDDAFCGCPHSAGRLLEADQQSYKGTNCVEHFFGATPTCFARRPSDLQT